MSGSYECTERVTTQLSLPELHDDRMIEWDFHLADDLGNYDMIIGRDLLQELGLVIDFKAMEVEWDDARMPMKDITATAATSYHVHERGHVDEMSDRVKEILDAKYEKADARSIAREQAHLSKDEQSKLEQLLTKYQTLFDGTLGRWRGAPYDIELVEGAKPYHARAYPVPKAYERTLHNEVERLCQVGVLKR